MKKMMELTYEVRSEAKIKGAVKAYHDWRNMTVECEDCKEEIIFSDLDDLCSIDKKYFEYVMCRFIVEVKKSKEDLDYPGRTLYQLAVAIQNHLKMNKIYWKLVHSNGEEFEIFYCVLDKEMQERSPLSIGTIKRQAEVICMEYENILWQNNVLGEDSPGKLRSIVYASLSQKFGTQGLQ